jgi:hypothetical protein
MYICDSWYVLYGLVTADRQVSRTSLTSYNIYIYVCVCVCVQLMSLERLLLYLTHLYMFRAFVAHLQEIMHCLVSRYGKRKCGRELWCPVVSLVWSVHP